MIVNLKKNLYHSLFYISLPVPNPSSEPKHQHIHSAGDPPVEVQRKAKAPHATVRAAMFSPSALHGESTALGGLAACQIGAGKV